MNQIEYAKHRHQGKKALNLNKSLGIPNSVLHHGWNSFMVGFSIWLVCLYYVQVWGPYNVRRGILGTAAIVYPEIPMACLYLYSFCADSEYTYVVDWIAKGSIMHLAIAACCQLIDFSLFLFANGAFCKLQLEPSKSDCAERN